MAGLFPFRASCLMALWGVSSGDKQGLPLGKKKELAADCRGQRCVKDAVWTMESPPSYNLMTIVASLVCYGD
jgi:hypothetical protein